MAEAEDAGRHRIDRWLWFTRFFRSRSLAAGAVTGGKVHVNGIRVKPARHLLIGDRLEITRGTERWDVIVRALPSRRGPSAEAQACFEESPDSVERRVTARRQVGHSAGGDPGRRPDKRERRAIRRLQGRIS